MLQVVLLILKILGMILLSILGLAAALVLAVLFVPIRYRVDAEKGGAVDFTARISWLLHFLSVRYELQWTEEEKKQDLTVRILGIPVFRPFRRKEKKPKHAEKSDSLKSPAPAEQTDEPKEPEYRNKQEQADRSFDSESSGNMDKPKQPSGSEPIPEKEEKKSWFRKLQLVGEKIDAFLEFWEKEPHVRAREALLHELAALWKKIRPRRAQGRLLFGLEDPAATGICMGILSILCAWYPDTLVLEPDFEQKILEGTLRVRGRASLGSFALAVWHLWRNRDVRELYRNWKRK